jgi:hypothetical protein
MRIWSVLTIAYFGLKLRCVYPVYNAREVLELLIESCQAEGKPLPATKKLERLFQAA